MRTIKIIFLFFLLLFIIGCNQPSTNDIEIINIRVCSYYEMDLDYPYLYIAGWEDGLWKLDISNDNFTKTYIPVLDSIESISRIVDITAEGEDIIINTFPGLWRSEDRGANWINMGNHLLESIDRFPGQSGKLIFDKYGGTAIYYSDNYGTTWDSVETGVLTAASMIEMNPYREGEAWIFGYMAGTGMGIPYVFCVDSCGQHLKTVVDMVNELFSEDATNHVNSIAFDPDNPDNIFLCITNDRKSIFKSSNGGFNWQELLTDTLQINYMCNDAVISDKYYALCYDYELHKGELYCITDNFQTFQFLGELTFTNTSPLDIIHEPVQNLLLIGDCRGVTIVKLGD
ncbi:MAG: hypothetical protein JXR21_00920 [Candidatus Marinimicrobia bacterium]|nr:hypothetical protein [Candidatus Neomarinimicrobiota bacterium]